MDLTNETLSLTAPVAAVERHQRTALCTRHISKAPSDSVSLTPFLGELDTPVPWYDRWEDTEVPRGGWVQLCCHQAICCMRFSLTQLFETSANADSAQAFSRSPRPVHHLW